MTKLILSLALALSLSTFAIAAEKAPAKASGKIIARDDLPAAVKGAAKKAAKYPGIPSCAKGRLETTWGAINSMPGNGNDSDEHVCAESATIYVCTAFGKLSIRCENPRTK